MIAHQKKNPTFFKETQQKLALKSIKFSVHIPIKNENPMFAIKISLEEIKNKLERAENRSLNMKP